MKNKNKIQKIYYKKTLKSFLFEKFFRKTLPHLIIKTHIFKHPLKFVLLKAQQHPLVSRNKATIIFSRWYEVQ